MKLDHLLARRLAWTGMLGLAAMVVLSSQANTPIDWPRWRGPHDNGSVDGGAYPSKIDTQAIRWKTSLPGKGCSTPIVWKNRIYVTAPVEGHDALLAYDVNGKLLWKATFGPESPGKHRNGSGSNASPATDGDAVFVYFKSGTLAAVELDGRVRWQINLVERYGAEDLFWDHGTSPVLTQTDVVMARMHAGDSWLAAFDKKTGKLHWKTPRNYKTPLEGDQSYTTPLVIEYAGQQVILTYGAEHITLHAAKDGRLLGELGGFNPQARTFWPTVSSPVKIGDMIVVSAGRNDRNIPRLHGIRLDEKDTGQPLKRIWKREDTGTFVPTPAARDGKLYLLRDRGEVECIEPATGNTLWSDSLPRHRARYYASPFVTKTHIYLVREDGVAFVAAIGNGFKLVSQNELGDRVIGSPAPLSDRRLLLRSDKYLWCVGQP